ncbi:glycoside hydrolase family 44 protein [Nannocystaceae bacterium ST9]
MRLSLWMPCLAVTLSLSACKGSGGDDEVGEGNDATGDGDGDASDSTVGDGDADSTGDGDSTGDADSTGDGDGVLVEPGDPGPADLSFEIRADTERRPISPLIYGINGGDDLEGSQKGATLLRSGGNRMTAYNWETNASNAGSDYQHQNDNYLVANLPADQQDDPGAAVRGLIEAALAHDASALLTIPICGYVAADKDGGGDVNQTPNYLDVRFHPSIAFKGAPLDAAPNPDDDAVYQDEFVHWTTTNFPSAFESSIPRILFSMDNEPDLWSSTHARIHPLPVGYQELVDENVEFARAVKSVAPEAWVTGFVSYGYNGYVTLQGAPDQDGEFLSYFLAAMSEAETTWGMRLIDVLDLHWYPEAMGGGQRITGEDVSPDSVEARVQAPRSLWDPSYTETSWIADYVGGPIALLPWIQSRIDSNYPGTGIGFTEYNYGAAFHISGAIAEADVLGIFGREGVALATFWPLAADNSMVYAAIRAFRSYDGADGHFGDTSIMAESSDVAQATVYASIDEGNSSRMVIVAINKTTGPLNAAITMAAYADYSSVEVYQLTDAGATIDEVAPAPLTATNALIYTMPALSVSVLVPVL